MSDFIFLLANYQQIKFRKQTTDKIHSQPEKYKDSILH